jgi:predicted amidophosphoribosyltransferase
LLHNGNVVELNVIHHKPRHIRYTLTRRIEFERDCPECPDDMPDLVTMCPDCGAKMAYRGIGRLRSGTRVRYFECVHSHREVHSVSIVVSGG